MAGLTNKALEHLAPPSDGSPYTILFDGELPGFGARITAAGVVSFTLDYRIHGRKRRYTIGRWPELPLPAARDEAIELRKRIREGEDPLAERERLRLDSPTMLDLAREYLASYAAERKRPRSAREDRRMFENIIGPKLGRQPVAAITQMDLENLHRSLRSTPYQANRVRALLSKALGLAVKWDWREDNPARGVEKYREEKRHDRWLSREEIRRVLRILRGYSDQQSANALRLLIYTGARKHEALTARWEDFDLATGRWTKPSHHTKQKRMETLPLSRVALWLLRRMHRAAGAPASGWLFPGRKADAHQEDLKAAWGEIRRLGGLEGVRIHDLRHTFASHLVSKGQSLVIVGKLLGHTQAATTLRYAHLADSALREAANRFGRRHPR
jgi:integrase